MGITLEPYKEEYLKDCRRVWNEVVEDGVAFPGDEILTEDGMREMFAQQAAVTCAVRDGRVLGLYILHPNNIGRCAHIANASYCVSGECRGQGVGGLLVENSLREAKACGFRGLQFNAVVVSNNTAVALYQKKGFTILGTVPGGFRLKDGSYSDTYIMYRDV